jgi:hypothetical protein
MIPTLIFRAENMAIIRLYINKNYLLNKQNFMILSTELKEASTKSVG